MNAAAYFETDPWEQLMSLSGKGRLGRVVCIAVQMVCSPGAIVEAEELWRERVGGILGKLLRSDAIRTKTATSLIARYHGNALFRLFIDEGKGVRVTDFEVVGTEALLVWKPDVRTLSRISTENGDIHVFDHASADSMSHGGAL